MSDDLEADDLEAHARCSSVLEILEHEGEALRRLRNPRLTETLQAMTTLGAEIVAALASLKPFGEVE